jgi:hypothetical protein
VPLPASGMTTFIELLFLSDWEDTSVAVGRLFTAGNIPGGPKGRKGMARQERSAGDVAASTPAGLHLA